MRPVEEFGIAKAKAALPFQILLPGSSNSVFLAGNFSKKFRNREASQKSITRWTG